ncbi:hypothetical protein BDF14DRAFT_1992525 [Spinellus fusiger]|nr:hypothetical protein BDF14DRAFT_1992525 [Spinellus fusiger]
MATEQDVQNRLNACCTLCIAYLKDLKEPHQVDSPEFDPEQFKDTMGKIGQVLSHDATKLSLACKPPRKVEDAIQMVQELCNTLYRLLGFYHTIPTASGNAYRTAYSNLVRDILQGAHTLCTTFKGESPTFMVPTAILWESCTALGKSPKNNEAAIRIQWDILQETLKDAKSEVHSILEEEEEEEEKEKEETSTPKTQESIEQQKALTLKCTQLVDLTVLIYKKIQLRCLVGDGSVEWLDTLHQHAITVVDETDVLVSQLYEEDAESMPQHICAYVGHCLALVQIAQQVAKDENLKWFEMCAAKLESLAKA